MKIFLKFFLVFILLLSCSPGKKNILDGVREVKLKNGLTALLVKREGAPLFSAYIRIKVGNIEESPGSSGLAHFFEHMAFKGTPTIGSLDYTQEEPLLKKLHEKGTELVQAKLKGALAPELKKLQEEFDGLQQAHQRWVNPNEFVQIYQRNGGSDINATTSNDFTSYFVSLPSNKIKLWAYMESQRLQSPVTREFYKERDVVAEERRMRYENSPDGKLYEAYLDEAFDHHSPYGIPVIGYSNEIQNYTYEAASSFFKRYYTPSRVVIALVGNFDLNEAEQAIRDHFDSWQAPANPTPAVAELPKQHKERVISGLDEPRFYMGFYRPPYPDPDDEVFDVIQQLLCEGRTSRLFTKIVKEKHMAATLDCYASLPGSRLEGVFTFYASPLPSFKNKEIQDEIINEIERLKNEPISETELEKVRNNINSDTIWTLKSNMGLAEMLTYFQHLSGDWKYLFTLQEKVNKIGSEEIKRVVKKYFIPQNEVLVSMEKVEGKS